MEAIFFTD